MKRFLKAALLITSGFFVFLACLVLTIPKDLIETIIKKELQESAGIILLEKGFERVFPVGIEVKQASISYEKAKRSIMNFDDLQIKLNILYLFTGGIKIKINGAKSDGSLSGDIILRRKDAIINLSAKDMKLESIPYLDSINLVKAANFSGMANITIQDEGCPSGTIDIEGKDIDAGESSMLGIPLPLGKIEKTVLSARLGSCKINIKGLWLENKNLSANVHGDIFIRTPYAKSPIDIILEIMPAASYAGKDNYLLAPLANYRKSSNYYLIRVTGTIEMPILS